MYYCQLSHTDHVFAGSFFLFPIVAFSSTESLTEYLIAPVGHSHIILPVLHCRTIHSFKFTLRDFHHALLTLLSGEVWVHTFIIIHRDVAGLL